MASATVITYTVPRLRYFRSGETQNIALRIKEIDQHDLKKKIASAFHRNATIDSKAIEVEVGGTRITLKGHVRSWFGKEEAERIAWSSTGVSGVDNQIFIDAETYFMMIMSASLAMGRWQDSVMRKGF